MIILAVDSSAAAASAVLVQDGKILGEFYCNNGLTHSRTLMPMIRGLLENTCVPLKDVDLLAVSAGPGSFTGIRIGIASVKGLAMPESKPCAGVSTLEAAAQNLSHLTGTACAVMDARCKQVYNAVFTLNGSSPERLTPDRAISIADLAEECKKYPKPIFLVGDGAKLCYNNTGFQAVGAVLPPETLIFQRASGVARSAEAVFRNGGAVSPSALVPVYLRPAQAERSLKRKAAPSQK